ncbi:MAG: hypothetical protein GX625_18510 [Clostridiaceae bacterium]|jgi:hypothetical protein|nr:hypothetical protein [Clostridiaceae bacterium]
MLELQFINTLVDNAKVINLGVFKDEKEMTKEINKRCKLLNGDSKTTWKQFFSEDGYIWVDFGSPSKYFRYKLIEER